MALKLMKIFTEMRKGFNWLFNIFTLWRHGVKWGRQLKINGRIYIKNDGKIVIGDYVTINSGARFNPVGGESLTKLIAYSGGEIVIGDNVGISNSTIISQEKIVIKRSVKIGGSCNIFDTDFHSLDPIIRGSARDRGRRAPVDIGEHCFIGAQVIILKGVSIGKCSIVGAGSVVRRSIPDGEVWCGNPARKIALVSHSGKEAINA